MELTTHDIELIEACFFEKATQQQLQQLANLRQNPAFEKQYTLHITALQAIQQKGRTNLKNHLKKLEASINPTKRLSIHAYLKPLLSIAVLLIFALSIFWMLQPTNQIQTIALYEEHYKAYPNTIAPIKRSTPAKTNLQKAFLAYDEANYQKALPQLKQLSNQNPKIDIYVGICHLELGQVEIAKTIFTKIISQQNPQKDAAIWYLALAHLKTDNSQESVKNLQLIKAESLYHNRAQKLIKQLQK